jgi:hypothetical protein
MSEAEETKLLFSLSDVFFVPIIESERQKTQEKVLFAFANRTFSVQP